MPARPASNLAEFLTGLERIGELKRIAAPTSVLLDIARAADAEARRRAPSEGATGKRSDPEHAGLGGSALLFEHPEIPDPEAPFSGRFVRSRFPVAINTFGSYRRMERALGCPPEAGFEFIADRIASLTRPHPPAGLTEIIAKAREFWPLLRIAPRLVSRGRCQEVIRTGGDVNLFELPIIKCWPLDGDIAGVNFRTPPDQPDIAAGMGRYITFAGMHTIHAEDIGKAKPPSHNIGMYRAQLLGRSTLAMHWHMHHDGARHWRSWKALGKAGRGGGGGGGRPIAIVLGGESVLPYAATCPLPPGISELLMAGFLNGGGIPLVPCKTVPLRVPANAEIVIEGWVSTESGLPGFDSAGGESLGPGAVFEGPFGDHTGFYSLPDRYPIMQVTAITHARDAVYPTTIVGLPPQEDYYLGKATERIMLPLLRTLVPDVIDYDLPLFGCFHNCAVVKIKKEYPLQARRVMHALWGAGQMSWTKWIIVVDEEVEVHRFDAVLAALAAHFDPAHDVELVRGPLDILDHAAPALGVGSKIGFDATRKFPDERAAFGPAAGAAAPSVRALEPVRAALLRHSGVAAVELPSTASGLLAFVTLTDPGAARPILAQICADTDPALAPLRLLFAFDPRIDIRTSETALFHFCANADPGRDMIRGSARTAFDATRKSPADSGPHGPVRPYPPLISFA